MRDLRPRRAGAAALVLVVAVAVAVAVALLTVGPASATAKTVICRSLTGNLTTTPITFTLGGCTGNTGGSGTAEGDTITWANGQTTGLTTAAFPVPSGRARRANCADLSDKYAIKDAVYGDTTGSIKNGGKVSADVCILNQAPDPWSLAPGSVFRLR